MGGKTEEEVDGSVSKNSLGCWRKVFLGRALVLGFDLYGYIRGLEWVRAFWVLDSSFFGHTVVAVPLDTRL